MDYLNYNWLKDDLDKNFHERSVISVLYDVLLSNSEVTHASDSAHLDQDPHLSDFERDFPTADEQKHYINALLENQVLHMLHHFLADSWCMLFFFI